MKRALSWYAYRNAWRCVTADAGMELKMAASFSKGLCYLGLVFSVTATLPSYAQSAEETLSLLNQNYDSKIFSSKETASGYETILGSPKSNIKLNLACIVSNIEIESKDPVSLEKRKIHAKLYIPRKIKDSSQLKTVIIMPPTGGVTILDKTYSMRLCGDDVRAVLIEGWDHDVPTLAEENLEMHDSGAIRMVSAVRHVVEYLQPVRKNQIGILGTSVGAISSSLVMSVDSRISTGVLIVGGGGLLEIISQSTEKNLARLRKSRMAEYKLESMEEYQQLLSPYIKIDPLTLIPTAEKKKILMVIGQADVTVPTANQKKLLAAYGNIPVIYHSGDHLNTILKAFELNQTEILKFLVDSLN